MLRPGPPLFQFYGPWEPVRPLISISEAAKSTPLFAALEPCLSGKGLSHLEPSILAQMTLRYSITLAKAT